MSDESENPNENPEELAHRDSITSARLSNQSSSVPLTSITGSGESLRSNNAAPAQEASRRSSNNTRNQSQADGGPEDGRSRQSSNASASLSDSQREQSGSLGQSSAVDFRERGSIPTEAFGEHGSQIPKLLFFHWIVFHASLLFSRNLKFKMQKLIYSKPVQNPTSLCKNLSYKTKSINFLS